MLTDKPTLAAFLLPFVCLAACAFAQANATPAGEKSGWLEEGMAVAASQEAQAPVGPAEKAWEIKFKLTPWQPNYHGSATVAGNKSTVDVSCNDIFYLFDEVRCLLPVNLEARCGQWGMIMDLFYMRVKDSFMQGPLTVDVESTQTILELAGFYRAGTWPVGGETSLTLDIIAGGRYQRLTGNIGLTSRRGNAATVSGAREWWDPFIGPRVTLKPADWLSLSLRADVGGFDITNCSDCTWQVVGAAEVSLSDHCFLELGYRALHTDYSRSGGRFAYDVTMSGPYLALGVKF